MGRWMLRVLETPEEMQAVEAVQRQVWPGSETDVVPAHMLLAAVHNGGLIIGAYPPQGQVEFSETAATGPVEAELIGFVYGFPGIHQTNNGMRLKHVSHMLGVLPAYRDQGVGFALKRAQWQMVRHQTLDVITWTYDPLLSRNAFLNISRLGGICSSYHLNVYGDMRDGTNAGLPSDRFRVDWWVNTNRVALRLSSRPRLQLDLAHFLAAGAEILNPTEVDEQGFPHPVAVHLDRLPELMAAGEAGRDAILLVEIPANFMEIKAVNPGLAYAWRMHTREAFQRLFAAGYLVTDFIHLAGSFPRSFYVLSHGESTL
jgi:predicted GNAT superfamily acetyltransferase